MALYSHPQSNILTSCIRRCCCCCCYYSLSFTNVSFAYHPHIRHTLIQFFVPKCFVKFVHTSQMNHTYTQRKRDRERAYNENKLKLFLLHITFIACVSRFDNTVESDFGACVRACACIEKSVTSIFNVRQK